MFIEHLVRMIERTLSTSTSVFQAWVYSHLCSSALAGAIFMVLFFFFLRMLKPCKVSVYHNIKLSLASIPKPKYEWHIFCEPSIWFFIYHGMNVMELVFKQLFFLTGVFAWLTHGYRKIPWSTLSKSNIIMSMTWNALNMINLQREWGHRF